MIRDYADADAAGVAEVIRETSPGWVATAAGVRHRAAAAPERARRLDWVAEDGGRIVGWASASLETAAARQDVAYVRALVRPAWRGRGLGAALHERAEAHALALGARRLLAEGAADDGSRAFARRRGYRHTMTRQLLRLDPNAADPGALAALAAELAPSGYEAVPFAAFADQPELVHAVDAEASTDEPLDEPNADLPFQEWLREHWRQPDLCHEASFCVVHDGRPVAVAEVKLDRERGEAGNGFTGTLRPHRGRGLARLAKLAGIEWLRDHGVASLVTQNDGTNAAMLAVNERLGYRPYASRLAYVRDV